MSLELIPLDEGALPPAVRKAVSPSAPLPLRTSIARGLAPLPPADLALALYQLAVGDDPALAETARRTAGELPDPVLATALGSVHEPRVLDLFASALGDRAKPLQTLLLNAHTADTTVERLAAAAGEATLEVIAQNEQRLLRHPPIITALYLNRRTRMSTATRALELAVRNGLRLEGIASFDEIKAAIESEGEAERAFDPVATDAAFARVLASLDTATAAPQPPPATDEEQAQVAAEVDAAADRSLAGQSQDDKAVQISRLPIGAKIRLAMLGSAPGVDIRGAAFARAVLVRDSNKMVALAAIRSPSVTEHEAELYAGNRGLCEEVIRYIAGNRMFVRRYSIKLSLVNNPKCPLQSAMGFLAHLTPKDLRAVARSKGIPSALSKAAKGLIEKRESR